MLTRRLRHSWQQTLTALPPPPGQERTRNYFCRRDTDDKIDQLHIDGPLNHALRLDRDQNGIGTRCLPPSYGAVLGKRIAVIALKIMQL